jgi:hypothetical protein
LRRSGE